MGKRKRVKKGIKGQWQRCCRKQKADYYEKEYIDKTSSHTGHTRKRTEGVLLSSIDIVKGEELVELFHVKLKKRTRM